MLVELPGASKTHPAGLGTLPTIIGASFDQVPLERSEAGPLYRPFPPKAPR
jgi:hypothetical protein